MGGGISGGVGKAGEGGNGGGRCGPIVGGTGGGTSGGMGVHGEEGGDDGGTDGKSAAGGDEPPHLDPQSLQSVPSAHALKFESSPPSSQTESPVTMPPPYV